MHVIGVPETLDGDLAVYLFLVTIFSSVQFSVPPADMRTSFTTKVRIPKQKRSETVNFTKHEPSAQRDRRVSERDRMVPRSCKRIWGASDRSDWLGAYRAETGALGAQPLPFAVFGCIVVLFLSTQCLFFWSAGI